MQRFLARAARPAEIVLGLVFLAGAVLKALDINLFAIQIWAYGVLPVKTVLPTVALITLAIETVLGSALVLGIRARSLTLIAVEGLLTVFTALIVYGWLYHGLKDCGCFGPLEVSPAMSIAKNVVLAALGGVAWIGAAPVPVVTWKRRLMTLAAMALATAGIVGYAFSTLECTSVVSNGPGHGGEDPAGREGEGGEERPFAQFTVATEQGTLSLGTGDYIVAILSMDCEHCMQEAPALNDLLDVGGLPPVVGLCFEEKEGDLQHFVESTNLQIPLQKIGKLQYFMLIDEDTFRVYLVRDGRPAAHWDGKPPTLEQLADALARN